MDGVVAHDQADVTGRVAPVVALVMILAVETQDHVATIPEAGTDVDLLPPVHLQIAGNPGRDVVPAEADMCRLAPVVEIVGGIGDHHSLLSPFYGMRDRPSMPIQVIEPVESDQTAGLQPTALDDGVVGGTLPAEPIPAVGRADGPGMHLPDHLETPVRIGIVRLMKDQTDRAVGWTLVV